MRERRPSVAPKLHVTVSPALRLTAAGVQRSPEGVDVDVLAAGPAGARSSAENLTVSGPEYVCRGPARRVQRGGGDRCGRVVVGAPIVKATDLAVSTLPAASVER